MQDFPAKTTVTLNFPFVSGETTFTPDSISWKLTDAEGEILWEDDNASPSSDNIDITIPASYNQTNNKIDVRQLEVIMLAGSEEYTFTTIYRLLNNSVGLTVLTDSFMTYPESVMIRSGISESLENYDMLTDDLKITALENSFARLAKLKFKINGVIYNDITDLTVEQFKALDPKFLKGIKRAQIVEADIIVEHSPSRDKIRAGIISETIGESSMFFNQSGIPSSRFKGISDEAYEYVKEYLFRNASSAHIWRIQRA